MAALLEAVDLEVSLDGRPVLRGVSLALEAGASLVLVGASGSGKTTLLRTCMGLLPARARVAGGLRCTLAGKASRDLRAAGPGTWRRLRRRDFAWIPQEPGTALDPRRSAAAHLRECVAARWGQVDLAGRVAEGFDQVGLPAARAHEYPHQWSGGMQQRLLVAMAAARQPQLLLADEPTSALDGLYQRQLLELLARLRAECGFALVWVTHDLALAPRLGADIAVLAEGRLVEQGSTLAVLQRPQHPATAALAAGQARWPPAAGAVRA